MKRSDKLDRDTASKFEDGFPHHWRQFLRAAFSKKVRSKKVDLDEDLDSEQTIELKTPSRSAFRTPEPLSGSRSTRKRMPPLDFWCNERIVDGRIIRPQAADLPLWSPTMLSSNKKKKRTSL
jgi:hypothetical protein